MGTGDLTEGVLIAVASVRGVDGRSSAMDQQAPISGKSAGKKQTTTEATEQEAGSIRTRERPVNMHGNGNISYNGSPCLINELGRSHPAI